MQTAGGTSLRLALFQPDIPQNVGTLLRLGACLGVAVDIVEPCGFLWDDRRLKRAGLDYLTSADYRRHSSWKHYLEARRGRLLLLTTKAETLYTEVAFAAGDTLMLGRESAGVPDFVHAAADLRLKIPLRPGQRALNVAVAGAMVLGEALRQCGAFPHVEPEEESKAE